MDDTNDTSVIAEVDDGEFKETLLTVETNLSDETNQYLKPFFLKVDKRKRLLWEKQVKSLMGSIVDHRRNITSTPLGPSDQNEKLKLNVQLPNSASDFESNTEFNPIPEGGDCFEFCIKSFEKYDELNKIAAYRIKSNRRCRK